MELLAPAGGRDALLAALNNGADAVYVGGKDYSARQSADNFDLHQLEEAVLLAHSQKAKLYVTLNTLLREEELAGAVDYAAQLYQLGVDALIVTDLGLISALRASLPQFPLHASTQMTIHEENAAHYLAGLGLERIVLARELSLDDIEAISNVGIQTEVFIHGALCISYSGQCLFSSLIGGRSGNRGRCAQPCRLPYTLIDPRGGEARAGYLLSSKDLCYLPALPKLAEANVTSLKIEGRMKRPEYVATVVRIYREALDNLAAGKHLPTDRDLLSIFNRGFSTGYLFENPGARLMSYQRPNNRGVPLGRIREYRYPRGQALIALDQPLVLGDGIEVWVSKGRVGATVEKMTDERGKSLKEAKAGQRVWVEIEGRIGEGDRVFRTADRRLLERATASYESIKPIPLSFTLKGKIGEEPTLLGSALGQEVEVRGEAKAQRAQKRALDGQIAARHLFKLGDTPFIGAELILELEGKIALPPSELNRLRREAVAILSRKIRAVRALPPEFSPPSPSPVTGNRQKPLLAVRAGEGLWQAALAGGADLIYLPAELPDLAEAISQINRAGSEAALAWPRISTQAETARLLEVTEKYAPVLAGILIGHLGQLDSARKPGLPVASDFSFNVANSEAAKLLTQDGIERITLSVELRHEQMRDILQHSTGSFEAIVGGSLPLMITRHCPVGSATSPRKETNSMQCSGKMPCQKGMWFLQDRMGVKLPLTKDASCITTIYNGHQLSVLEELPTILKLGLSVLRLEAPFGDPGSLQQIVALHREELDLAWERPHYRPRAGLREELEQLWGTPVTGGHFFRGVE